MERSKSQMLCAVPRKSSGAACVASGDDFQTGGRRLEGSSSSCRSNNHAAVYRIHTAGLARRPILRVPFCVAAKPDSSTTTACRSFFPPGRGADARQRALPPPTRPVVDGPPRWSRRLEVPRGGGPFPARAGPSSVNHSKVSKGGDSLRGAAARKADGRAACVAHGLGIGREEQGAVRLGLGGLRWRGVVLAVNAELMLRCGASRPVRSDLVRRVVLALSARGAG